VVLTGGTGLLGSFFKQSVKGGLYPTRQELDILDFDSISRYMKNHKTDLFIHCAAYTDVKTAEKSILPCIETNVIGCFNVLKYCMYNNIRLVYISTDAVFDGTRGDYTPGDPINPISVYSRSKASAELMVRSYKNSLIIRTSFFDNNFPYDQAFVDCFTTKDYIDIIGPEIIKSCLSNKTGIVHVVSKKRSFFDLAKQRKKDIKKISYKDFHMKDIVAKNLTLKE
jgi:dTDP-4-dehydrorhamnose reductase